MDNKIRKKMQEQGLESLARNPGGFQFTDTFFPYTSGQIGPYYVQSGAVQCTAKDYNQACKDFSTLAVHILKDSIDVIAGGESRDWIFSFAVSRELKLPHVMLYKDSRTLGADIKNKNIAIISDLNNEGSSLKNKWKPAIEINHGTVNYALFYVDRLEDGVEVLNKLNILNDAVVPLNNYAWDYLQKIRVINKSICKNLRERGKTKESRHNWAVKMLRSDKGFKKFSELFENSKTKGKAINILKNGYPELKSELIERLIDINK